VEFASATLATTNPLGDAQPPSAAQMLGGGVGGHGGVAVAGPAAPVATAGAAAAARTPAAGCPPHPTRGVGGAGALGGIPLAAPPGGAIVIAAGGARRPPAPPRLALSAPTQSSEMAGDHLGDRCAFDSSHNDKFLYYARSLSSRP